MSNRVLKVAIDSSLTKPESKSECYCFGDVGYKKLDFLIHYFNSFHYFVMCAIPHTPHRKICSSGTRGGTRNNSMVGSRRRSRSHYLQTLFDDRRDKASTPTPRRKFTRIREPKKPSLRRTSLLKILWVSVKIWK